MGRAFDYEITTTDIVFGMGCKLYKATYCYVYWNMRSLGNGGNYRDGILQLPDCI